MLAESAVMPVNAIKPTLEIVGLVTPELETTWKLVAEAVTSTAPWIILRLEVIPVKDPITTPSTSQGTPADSFVR